VIKVLVDVNLSPAWTATLGTKGIEAVHWSTVGDPRASDDELLRYAREHGYIVFTHDLDFGALLALTRANGPSVIQVRAQNILPDAIVDLVVRVLTEQAAVLAFRCPRDRGALRVARTGAAHRLSDCTSSAPAARDCLMHPNVCRARGRSGVGAVRRDGETSDRRLRCRQFHRVVPASTNRRENKSGCHPTKVISRNRTDFG